MPPLAPRPLAPLAPPPAATTRLLGRRELLARGEARLRRAPWCSIAIFLEEETFRLFYHSFCKGILWPVFHNSLEVFGEQSTPLLEYDDIYEYRYARIRVRRFPARFDALFDLLHADEPRSRANGAGSPALAGTRDGHDGDAPRDIGVVRGAQHARYARSCACVSIGGRRDVSAGAFPARASRDRGPRLPQLSLIHI